MDTSANRSEFRFSQSAVKMTYWLVTGLGIFILALAGLVFFGGTAEFGVRVGAGLMALAGIGCIVFATWYRKRRESDTGPKLIIDSTMIHPVTATAKPIPWGDVEKVVFIQTRPKRPGYMAIDVKGDVNRFEPTRGTRMMAKTNSVIGYGEISVASLDFDGSHDQIKAAILAANPNVEVWDK